MIYVTTPQTKIDNLKRTASSLKEGYVNKIYFNGDKAVKIFTLKTDSALSDATLTLSQGPIGSTGSAFSIIPGTTNGSSSFTLPTIGDSTSFIISYDSSKGSATEASLTSDIPIYVEGTNTVFIDSNSPFYIEVENSKSVTKRHLGPLLNRDKSGNYIINQSTGKITQDETSFGLIRTNPKLSGNVKITVDSNNAIWLNSIDADKELADERFKKYKLGPESSYALDLNRFFDYGQTPTEIVFSLYEKDPTYLSTKRSFDEQFDRFYQYGATQLSSKSYDEDFSFFAPLYLKYEIPEYFVIFRTDGPFNKFTYEALQSEWQNHVSSDILANSQIIKTFDLSEKSNIGKYLRGIVNHPSRRESEITVSYQENGYTTFNGISYQNGTYVQAGELLYDYINEENPLTNTEEFITLGFQRNGVISSHVINLEFLFNDDDAENYSINRYFGLYVNSIDLASFSLNDDALSQFSFDINQTPFPRKGIDGTKVSQKSFVQTNNDGIKLYIEADSIESLPKITESAFSSIVDKIEYISGTTFSVEILGKFDDKLITLASFTFNDDVTTLNFSVSSFNSTIPFSLFLTFKSWWIDFYTPEKLKSFEKKVFDNNYIEKAPRLFYLKDNDNNLSSVASTAIKYTNTDPFTRTEVIEVSLKDTKVDISNYSGFSNLLTQTESKLLSKSSSSISIEIKKSFSSNDFIEIRWYSGGTIQEYPLRWRAVANHSNLAPGEHWPSYAISTDSEGDYYLSYFHPGDSDTLISTIVKSIQDAFDVFPFKNFEVLAKGNFLHFKSTQEGRFSESSQLLFSNFNVGSIYVMGIPAGENGIVNFIGASNKNKTRARISKDVAEGMLLEEYISTRGSFTNNRSYDILGSTIVFSPYLDEPIYDEDGEKLIDFKDSDIYRVISLDEEGTEIQITSDDKITTYELFRPKFGILSVLPVKDFDSDFYVSDYVKTYTPELIKYFGRDVPPTKIVSMTGVTGGYTCTFDKSFEFPNYPVSLPFLLLSDGGSTDPILYNESTQIIFNSEGNTGFLVQGDGTISIPTDEVPTVGSTILMLPNDKHLYYTEELLSKFKGFLTLSNAVSDEDEARFESLENLWDPSRFNPELSSEYDRLGENFLKTLALKSRVVPYCAKWVSPQGRDVRDNPYRFNYHRSFGNMNFSPSENLQVPNPIFFTHEWPYIDSVPLDFPILDYPESTFSYFFDELNDTYDFSSLSRDWFTQYFSVGFPVEKTKDKTGNYQSVKIDPIERYSYFNYESFTENTYTFFRGYRLQISEKDLLTGQILPNSKKYNNYRFSVIIKTEEEDPVKIQDPIEFKTIVNEKWKFIVLKITVRSASYRFPSGKIGYTDIYTFQNSNDKAFYDYETSPTFPLIGFTSTIPTDKKLSYPVNLENSSLDPTLSSVFNYYDSYPSNNTFIDNLVNQILPLPNGNFSNIIAFNDSVGFQTCATIPAASSVYDLDSIQLSDNKGFLKISAVLPVLTVTFPYSTVAWKSYTFYHQTGGNNSLKDLSERLSFQEISKVIKGTSVRATMQYDIYLEDGSTLNSANFVMNTIAPEPLTRIYDYYPVTDPIKPSAFYNLDNIGVILQEQKDLQTIYRYQGDFSPKFKDVLKFWLRESDDFTSAASRDFLLNNTHFAEELKDFSILNNQFYNKVSDTEILTLSPDSGFSPVYPLINEISIDRRPLFTWCSSWDQNYYRKHITTSSFQEVKGTEEMKEVKSMFGSKLMKVPDQYDLYQFRLQEMPSLADLESSTAELSYHLSPDTLTVQVNVYERLLREMLGSDIDMRAKTEFSKAVNEISDIFGNSTIYDKAKEYLIDNIIDLYQIGSVKLYVLQTGSASENLIATASNVIPFTPRSVIEFNSTNDGNQTFNEIELRSKKYIMKNDVKVIQLDKMKFQIVYPLDSRFYTSISVGVTTTRI